MIENKDYIYISKAEINVGLTSGSFSEVAVFFTNEYFFVIPYGSFNLWNRAKIDFHDAESFIQDLYTKAGTLTSDKFNETCKDFLPNSRIYDVESLEIFSIKQKFLFLGGIKIKKRGEQIQIMKINQKSSVSRIKSFYNK